MQEVCGSIPHSSTISKGRHLLSALFFVLVEYAPDRYAGAMGAGVGR